MSGMMGDSAMGAIIGGLFGMGQGAINNNQNKKAQQRAYNMQRNLNKQGSELALQMWKDTNYDAQRKQLEKAGLNAGLLYGGSGGGGVTANAGSGGSAPTQAAANYEVGGMALQGAMTQKQMELMDAQKENINADTENKRGAERENTMADTGLKKMETANKEILNTIQNRTIDETVNGIIANADKAQSEARSALVGANVNEETQSAQENQIKQNAINTALQAGAIKAGVKLTNEQTRKIGVDLAQGWEQLYQSARANDNQAGMVNIAGFKAKLDEILGKANIDLRAKELMVRSAEAVMGGLNKSSNNKKEEPKEQTNEYGQKYDERFDKRKYHK